MEEKIKVYVDSNEKGFITDCYLADNTKIICEFYHEESEIEYSNCKLLNLQEYDKQKDQRIAELEQELAELKEKAIVPKFSSGQIVYFANIVEGTVNKFNYMGEDKYNYVVEDKTGEVFFRMKERTFATEQEAQAKLKEIQGSIVGEGDE